MVSNSNGFVDYCEVYPYDFDEYSDTTGCVQEFMREIYLSTSSFRTFTLSKAQAYSLLDSDNEIKGISFFFGGRTVWANQYDAPNYTVYLDDVSVSFASN